MFMTTKEVAEKVGLEPRHIRFYKSMGLITPSNPFTNKKYTQKDIDEFLKELERMKNDKRTFEINKRFLKRAN